MTSWLRGLAAVMMGLIALFAIRFAFELISVRYYPLPPGSDPRDPATLAAAVAALPPAALVAKLLVWILAALAGAWLATRIARGDHRPAWFFGVLVVAASIGYLRTVPHPVWFWVAALLLYPVGIWLGARAGTVRSAP